MITLNIPDMHCNMCVERISKAFAAANIPCTIDLATQTVTVPQDQVNLATEELDDLGFSVA